VAAPATSSGQECDEAEACGESAEFYRLTQSCGAKRSQDPIHVDSSPQVCCGTWSLMDMHITTMSNERRKNL
jgi:hypothetical protein